MKIGMSHGAGGEVMGNLISQTILNNLSKKSVEGGYGLDALDDGATIPLGDYEIVVTTDGHTVNPLFFPGGDIGRISAAGTINDVSVMGAKPLAISNAMILQEGFPSFMLSGLPGDLIEIVSDSAVLGCQFAERSEQIIVHQRCNDNGTDDCIGKSFTNECRLIHSVYFQTALEVLIFFIVQARLDDVMSLRGVVGFCH